MRRLTIKLDSSGFLSVFIQCCVSFGLGGSFWMVKNLTQLRLEDILGSRYSFKKKKLTSHNKQSFYSLSKCALKKSAKLISSFSFADLQTALLQNIFCATEKYISNIMILTVWQFSSFHELPLVVYKICYEQPLAGDQFCFFPHFPPPWIKVMVHGGSAAPPASPALVFQISRPSSPLGRSDCLCDLSDTVDSSREWKGGGGGLCWQGESRGRWKELCVPWSFTSVRFRASNNQTHVSFSRGNERRTYLLMLGLRFIWDSVLTSRRVNQWVCGSANYSRVMSAQKRGGSCKLMSRQSRRHKSVSLI